MVYAFIRFINIKVFSRQLTSNIHIKALVLNILLFITTAMSILSVVYQGRGIQCVSFTVSNSQENVINRHLTLNSSQDKMYRMLFNFYSFLAYTVLASLTWSAHHFTRHMRFKAQNRQLKNGDASSGGCPWVEVTRSKPASPSKSCLLYTSPSPRDATLSRMPSSA